MPILPAVFNELAEKRRSVFPDQYDPGRQVPDDIIKQILVNATWAPNHGQAEPWFFKVFTQKGRQTLATLQSSLYKTYAGDQFNENKFLKI